MAGSLARLACIASPVVKHMPQARIWVHDPYCGRGIGTALLSSLVDLADRWLGLYRLQSMVYVDNEAAIGLCRRSGLRSRELSALSRARWPFYGCVCDGPPWRRRFSTPTVTPGVDRGLDDAQRAGCSLPIATRH